MNISLDRIYHWITKGTLGILDQGLYSGVNFLLSIILARLISPEVYGGFSAAFSLFLLLSNVQVALIAEPMSIFGADQYQQNTTSFLNYLLRIQWIGSFLGTCSLLFLAIFIQNDVLRDATMAMALAMPFIFLFWYLRRAFYIEMQSGMALVSSLIYSVLLLLTILIIQAMGHLTSWTAYFALALSSFITSIFTARRLGLHVFGKRIDTIELNFDEVNRRLWAFGRWIFPAYLAGWFTTFSFPFFITVLVDAPSAGAFRAIQNLFLPLQQLLAAITLLILPWLSRQKSEYGNTKLFEVTQRVAGVTGLAAVIYCALIVIFRREIVVFLYANEFYSSFDGLTFFLAFSTLVGSAPLILGLAFRVLGQPNIILWSKSGAAAFFLMLGVPMIWLSQDGGVIFALLGTAIIEVFLMLFFYSRVKKIAMVVPHQDALTGFIY